MAERSRISSEASSSKKTNCCPGVARLRSASSRAALALFISPCRIRARARSRAMEGSSRSDGARPSARSPDSRSAPRRPHHCMRRSASLRSSLDCMCRADLTFLFCFFVDECVRQCSRFALLNELYPGPHFHHVGSHSHFMGSYSHLMGSSFSPFGAPFSSHVSTHTGRGEGKNWGGLGASEDKNGQVKLWVDP